MKGAAYPKSGAVLQPLNGKVQTEVMKRILLSLSWLIVFLALPAAADTINFTFEDDAGNPIPDVVIDYSWGATSPATSGSGVVFTDSSGKASVSHPGLGGSACMLIGPFQISIRKAGWFFSVTNTGVSCGPFTRNLLVRGFTAPPMRTLSAANYVPKLTSDMMLAAFGTNLANVRQDAVFPLSTTLGQRSVILIGPDKVARRALLLFVSPQQINFITPSNLPLGDYLIKVVDSSGATISGSFLQAAKVVPGVFTANATGSGVPAAVIVRVRPNGVQSYESVLQYDAGLQRFTPLPIDLGSEGETVYLVLFGTGWRHVQILPHITVKIGDIVCPVEYYGPQPSIVGLDQMNIRLPRSLAGKDLVDVTIGVAGEDGANVTQIRVK